MYLVEWIQWVPSKTKCSQRVVMVATCQRMSRCSWWIQKLDNLSISWVSWMVYSYSFPLSSPPSFCIGDFFLFSPLCARWCIVLPCDGTRWWPVLTIWIIYRQCHASPVEKNKALGLCQTKCIRNPICRPTVLHSCYFTFILHFFFFFSLFALVRPLLFFCWECPGSPSTILVATGLFMK